MTKSKRIPLRYIPNKLTKRDKKKQLQSINKSKKLYKKHKYYIRPNVASFSSKISPHIIKAKIIYKVNNMIPNIDEEAVQSEFNLK